ncbi:TPA: hypothetical protein N2O29_003794 [Citrobacter amalonaticus]|nr:hypothetical protein [Citrobacter amalonaticus]
MKLGNTLSLCFTVLLEGFTFPYCPLWDKALNKLMDEGTLLNVKHGNVLFEHDTQLYEVSVGIKFRHYGHLVELNNATIHESVMRRPSFRTMDKLQRLVNEAERREAEERERELQLMIEPLLTK